MKLTKKTVSIPTTLSAASSGEIDAAVSCFGVGEKEEVRAARVPMPETSIAKLEIEAVDEGLVMPEILILS